MLRRGVLVTALAVWLFPSVVWAATTEIGPGDNLQAAVDALAPGDELVLQGGTYTLTSRFGISNSGTAQAPITIRAKDGEVPVITRDAGQNTINVDGADYIVLRGLEIDGGSHGIRLDDADFITIEDCHIHDTADVAISANIGGSTYEGLIIRHNHIHDTNGTGEGMYLGCNNNGCQMFDSIIELNWIHDTNTNVSQGDGIEIKEGSYNNIVRDNVIYNTNYPCILTYSTVGNGAPNIIERNVLWGCGDYGIQSAADAIIRNNIILSAASGGIGCQSHQAGSPSNLEIVHNTIVVPNNNAVRVSDISGSVLIANNALYAQNGTAITINGNANMVTSAGNAGIGGINGISTGWTGMGALDGDFVAATYSGGVPNDVFPAMGGLLVGAADATFVVVDDFNGTPREGAADIGAYRYDDAGNPGWVLSEAFKDAPPPSTGEGGAGGGATSSGAGGASASSSSAGTGASMNTEDGGDPNGESGCACRAVGTDEESTTAPWLMLLLGAAALRRRRPRAERRRG